MAVAPARDERLLRIGAVCDRLRDEFPDISISKIRYLEDQGLLTPQRTQGGYRLFGEDDVERLRTILRLQREEFLPLRVIRQELAAPSGKSRRRRRVSVLGEPEPEIELDELCERAGISRELVRGLEEYDRRRRGGRLREAAPLRHLGPPPARVPDGCGARVGPARAADRAGASRAERGPPRRGS
jgi:DNA-binding transcriptional MerR regulator